MILKRLIIYSIADDEIKKEYKFNEVGLNIILGNKSSNGDDSNGVGKSSMIDSMRYLLGAKIPNDLKNRKKIEDADFMLVLEINKDGQNIFLGRIVNKPDKGYIYYSNNLNFNLDNWGDAHKDTIYRNMIEEIILGDTDHDLHPSFASIREIVIRDEKEGFNDIGLPNRNAIKLAAILNYLFGIDFKGEADIKEFKQKQDLLEQKLKAIELLSTDIAELKVRSKKIKSEIENLVDISKGIDVNQSINISKTEYQDLKKQYNEITNKIIKLENMKSQYKENIDGLKTKVDQIKELDDIESFYNQIINYFPTQISKNYDEIESYYTFMVNSRGKYFGEKIDEINKMISSLEERKILISNKINKQIEVLKSTTIVDDINSILDKINEKNQELADINVKLEQYAEKDTISQQINDIKHEIIKQTNIKHEIYNSYRSIMKEAEIQFNELVNVTYPDEGGVLEFEFNSGTNKRNTTARITISCKIEDENSHGRTNMKVNMFDLTWLIQRIKHKNKIQFLIHDGSYVKPDNKKGKVRLLKYVDEVLKVNLAGQYFVTLNLEEVDSEDIEYFKKNESIIAFLSKDKDENRFMGIKYV
ncbi:MAG: DUF2326 domain-containing protein [Paraclostridium sp.]